MAIMLSVFENNGSINVKILEESLNNYYVSTGVNVFAIDEKGNKIISFGKCNELCDFFIKCNNAHNCKSEHLYSSKVSERLGEEYIFPCAAGLIHFTVPLIYSKTFKGALVGGPLLMNEPDSIMVDEILRKSNIEKNMRSKLMGYYKSIPIVDPIRVRHLSKLLFIIASNLMNEDKFVLLERKEKLDQQSKISETIYDIKNNGDTKGAYPYDKEKELLTKVKNGDVIGAKSILNNILGQILFNTGGNIEITKTRTLELCALLSRAAVEGGAVLDKVFGINYNFIGEISKINNVDELSYLILKMLDKFGENVFNLIDSKNPQIIKKSLNYINENYKENLTLEVVANFVHLNTSYFSTIFKREVGMSFSDYLNKIRIEASKRLLGTTDISILEVALSAGFEDQSYYSKVFKKIVGITPKKFRNSCY